MEPIGRLILTIFLYFFGVADKASLAQCVGREPGRGRGRREEGEDDEGEDDAEGDDDVELGDGTTRWWCCPDSAEQAARRSPWRTL